MSDEESDGLDPEVDGLLIAAKKADIATFKTLLKAGEDVLRKDKNGQTVLHWAARSGAVPVILAGVSKGLTWHINAKSKRGLTPLHDACLAGHVKAAHILLALGADVTAQSKEGYTPLLCAAGNGHPDVARVLVGAGCDPNQLVPPIGVNAVHIATWTGQADVLDILLQLGARTNDKSKIGKTATEFAADQDHTECLEILKKHTAQTQAATSQANEVKMLKSKMRRAEEKIRDYFEDKLKQEIMYFEKQLQDKHDEDMDVIAKLQLEVARLQSILGREQAQLLRGQPLRSQRPDLNRVPSVPLAPRPGGVLRRPRRLSDDDASDKISHSGSSDSAESTAEEDHHQQQEHSGLRRSPSSTDKTITALVEENSKKTNSVSYLRKSADECTKPPLIRTNSGGGLTNLPINPATSLRRGRVVSETPPTSPTIKTQLDGPFSEIVPSTSFGMPSSVDSDRLQVSDTGAPRTRRKSLTMLLRPIFFGDNTNKTDVKSTRRQSIVTRMPVSPPQDSQPKKKNKGLSLLQRPLPEIHAATDIEETES